MRYMKWINNNVEIKDYDSNKIERTISQVSLQNIDEEDMEDETH